MSDPTEIAYRHACDEIERLSAKNDRLREENEQLTEEMRRKLVSAAEDSRAADEIELLLEKLHDAGDGDTWLAACGRLEAEVERLRAENERLRSQPSIEWRPASTPPPVSEPASGICFSNPVLVFSDWRPRGGTSIWIDRYVVATGSSGRWENWEHSDRITHWDPQEP